MKRLFNLLQAVLLMVMLSACGKQDSSADKVPEQYGQTESAEMTGQAGQEQSAASETTQTEVQTEDDLTYEQEQQTQGGDNYSFVITKISSLGMPEFLTASPTLSSLWYI